MAGTFVTKTGPQFSRPIIVGGWLISLGLIPVVRMIVRRLLRKAGIVGPQAVMLGAGATARLVLDAIERQRLPAVRIRAIFDDDTKKQGGKIAGVEVVGPLQMAARWALQRGISTAVVAIPGMMRRRLVPLITELSKVFSRIIVIPDLFGLSSSEVSSYEIAGTLALELRNNLLYRHNRVIKRIIDLWLLSLSVVFILPLGTLIVLAIVAESGRPIFFRHERIGRGGRCFSAWKFRTMVPDAEAVLRKALENDGSLRSEWEANQKLKRDPRLTRVGRVLRRLSLDELPQLWNILRGEMSLVGPRPIVEGEIEKYGDDYDLYLRVRPGLTGLWQVSGRSDLSYEERVRLDAYYVRNWSVWLDLVILVRTVIAVLSGKGAY